ncbi:transposase [Chryseobacterium sp. MDT2-18]|uniref:transposase n=1 Tax=Chryseobacterium sp. MDT2-18 TaxID=1259136 RepID=UPI002781609D|nr:transposase [Chryseobacterium sp. MDT2-18]MDQ0476135.1 putative transposase [Chryseobacterium sp. MDT2-18]
MKKDISLLEPDHFYHIYNRGINGGKLFFNHQNYLYFLKLISEKVKPVAEIHSYCLLQNHFHLLVRIKSEELIRLKFPEKENSHIESIISQQFSNTFNSYSQAINKHFGRTGKLFELPFRRKKMTSEQQLINTILYINKNPAKHKITNDFLSYPYSSVGEILNESCLFVERLEVVCLFNDKDNFKLALQNYKV